MKVLAIRKGELVTIVNISVTDKTIYVSYIDSMGNLKLDTDWLKDITPMLLATDATV